MKGFTYCLLTAMVGARGGGGGVAGGMGRVEENRRKCQDFKNGWILSNQRLHVITCFKDLQ